MIHEDNPFAPTQSDPLRRFRGRLASPVTIVTAGSGSRITGLTVSSLFVIEGDPPSLFAAVGPNSDLFDVVTETGHFVVHICREGHGGDADVFAGLRPSPGGMFKAVEWEESDWGPVLQAFPDRAYCSLRSIDEMGWSGLLVGDIDRFDISDIASPLVHFRGSYRGLR